MATQLFRIYDDATNETAFNTDEATDGENVAPTYSIELGTDVSAGGSLKMQIRPGKRFIKPYSMVLIQTKYLSFLNLITNNADNYFIEYGTNLIPSLLTNDTNIQITNNFVVVLTVGPVTQMAGGSQLNYYFDLTLAMAELL